MPPALIEDCAKNNSKIPAKYRDQLLKLRMKKYIDDYVETNNYYRNYMGLPPMEDTEKDFVYLTDELLSGIPILDNPERPVHLMNNQDLTILYNDLDILHFQKLFYELHSSLHLVMVLMILHE